MGPGVRPARWRDVLDQFEEFGEAPEIRANRFANKWAGVLLRSRVCLDENSVTVTAEEWPSSRLWACIVRQSEQADHRLPKRYRNITNDPPRRTDRPVTVLAAHDTEIILDGRRRANLWARAARMCPVLVIRLKVGR